MSATASPMPALCQASSSQERGKPPRAADADAWRDVCRALQADDAKIYDAWFAKLRFVSATNGSIVLAAPTLFLRRWIEAHHLVRLRDAWRAAGVDVDKILISVASVIVRVVQPLAARAAAQVPATAAPTPEREIMRVQSAPADEQAMHAAMRLASPLNPHCRFETFVEGIRSNALALGAAKAAIGADPARRRSMNPLYLFSYVGLGKTHLLQAIVAMAGPERATYLTAERFCLAVASGLRRAGSFAAPSDLFRNDIVAIDDIQFISGTGLRREFARVVERLMEDGRQVVVASDRPADQHDLFEARLRSRLAGGLSVQIGRMEVELRRAVRDQKLAAAAALHPGLEVPERVAAMIAEGVTRDGRDLEGAVNRLLLLHATDGAVTPTRAEEVIADLLRAEEPRAVKIETILMTVALHYGCSRGDILSRRRTQNIVRPRQIAMFLAKEMTARSLPEIGRRLGGKDHTTVLHAVKKIGTLAVLDQSFAVEIEKLKREIIEAAA